jgi:uncharacterized membrane protein
MNFAKYISVIAATMLKFAGGPLTGLVLALNLTEIMICSVIGMMLMVILVMFFSEFFSKIRSYFSSNKPRKKFNRINRLAIKTRKKFGLTGVAFLTPLILTPAGGTILALAFNYSKSRILLSMFLWAIIWAVVQTLFFFYVKKLFF